MPFELQVALRYLTARRKQAFISVISSISVLGVVVGVMALMVALGLMTGLQREIRSRILGATAHLSVFKSGSGTFDDYREVVERVRKAPRVQGAAPALYGKGLLTSGTASAVATLKGIVPAQERTVTELGDQVEEGTLDVLAGGGEGMAPILLGRDLANALGVSVGDVVTVTSPEGRLSPMGVLPRVAKFRVGAPCTAASTSSTRNGPTSPWPRRSASSGRATGPRSWKSRSTTCTRCGRPPTGSSRCWATGTSPRTGSR